MSQRQVERPQEKKPRPADQGQIDNDFDIGDTDDILKELDIIEHPEKYTQEQRDCTCLRPNKGSGGFRD
jgi:hypothetical protein